MCVCVCVCVCDLRERDRETERQRDRDRETETDRETDRQTDRDKQWSVCEEVTHTLCGNHRLREESQCNKTIDAYTDCTRLCHTNTKGP